MGIDCEWLRLRSPGTAKLFRPDEDVEITILAQFADYLSPEVCAITIDNDGLLRVSTDPVEDDTLFIAYLLFSIAESLADCCTIQFSKLRSSIGLDLVLISHHTKTNSGFLKRLPLSLTP